MFPSPDPFSPLRNILKRTTYNSRSNRTILTQRTDITIPKKTPPHKHNRLITVPLPSFDGIDLGGITIDGVVPEEEPDAVEGGDLKHVVWDIGEETEQFELVYVGIDMHISGPTFLFGTEPAIPSHQQVVMIEPREKEAGHHKTLTTPVTSEYHYRQVPAT